MSKIIRNSIHCKKCDSEIESKNVHDFHWCACKSVAIDGGKEYLKRTGNQEDWVDTSIHLEYSEPLYKVIALVHEVRSHIKEAYMLDNVGHKELDEADKKITAILEMLK